MRCTLRNGDAVVFDDVLDQSAYGHFMAFFNSLDFRFVSANNWMKIWRVNDGSVIAGNSFSSAIAPFNSPLDWLHHNIYSLAKLHLEGIVGKEGEDWDEISYTPYIYGAGTKISWHDDTGYRAAAIFYCHSEFASELINRYGNGIYISPIPNRIAFTKTGVWHCINRVDSAAGDNLRCSFVAFFKKKS